jgi:hypothetical protein
MKVMENLFIFLSAATPWIAMGLLLAVFFARAARGKKEKEKKEDHASEGMALGMCFGVALSTALHIAAYQCRPWPDGWHGARAACWLRN